MDAPELDQAEIAAQHEVLLSTVRALEEVLPHTGPCHGGPRPLAAARALLERLAEQLHVHFAAEECDAHFGRIARSEPRLAHKIEELLQDHRQLRALAVTLAEDARHSDEDAAWVRATRTFWQLRERLAWHEREENELVFQLHQVDLGHGAGG